MFMFLDWCIWQISHETDFQYIQDTWIYFIREFSQEIQPIGVTVPIEGKCKYNMI